MFSPSNGQYSPSCPCLLHVIAAKPPALRHVKAVKSVFNFFYRWQVIGTKEYNPSIPGLARATIDTVIGGAAACEFKNCTDCNSAPRTAAGPNGDGCGWCPSFCEGRGKCMIGRNAPIFEKCNKHAVTGQGYRECNVVGPDVGLIAGVVVPGALVFFYIAYAFVRWIQRRHGSVGVYIKKKRFDFTYTGHKLNLLPPEGARYSEFFYLALATLLVGLGLTGVFESRAGPFSFGQEIYLDAVTSIQLDLDNCNVRFLPTRNFAFPTNAIAAIKLRFSIPDDPQIRLRTDTCSAQAIFKLENTRDPSLMYTNFFCFVQILVPDSFVMPRVVINAVGTNVTTVRSGPMDPDTRNFGLEFGANELVLMGQTMLARIENVSAKHFKFDVLHGSLLLTDVTNTPFATFNTQDADIVVTTDRQTSMRYWQKSENLVCLSAPSLFMDSSCTRVCDYVPQEGKTANTNTTSRDWRYISRVYRRRNLLQDCELVPGHPSYIPGCVLSDCSIDESSLCTCKPSCDMVPPDKLSFNGVSGVAGKCDTEGKCCRTICGGYSLSDLFPFPDSVRCGLCQPEESCSPPTCGTWTPGKLEQQWWFTSVKGQISLSVRDKKKSAQFHSYKGSTPSQSLSVKPDFSATEKNSLDEIFHPGGRRGPNQEWFWLRVSGPGAPPRTQGTFVWLRSIRFLVIPDYFLNVLSFGQLNPRKGAAAISLRPGYCPTFVDEGGGEMRRRIIELQQLLSKTLEYWPEDQPAKLFEIGALIAWIPANGAPAKFVLDPNTNQFGLSEIAQFTGDGEMTTIIVAISFLVPFVLSTLLVATVSIGFSKWLTRYRHESIMHESVILNLVEQQKLANMELFERMEKLEVPNEKKFEMVGRTSIWFMVESLLGDPAAAKTTLGSFFTVSGHMLMIAAPVLYIWNLAAGWKGAFQVCLLGCARVRMCVYARSRRCALNHASVCVYIVCPSMRVYTYAYICDRFYCTMSQLNFHLCCFTRFIYVASHGSFMLLHTVSA
jgi:hypothetical protein